MELIRGLGGVGRDASGCVLTIGNYDGIHLGHQALLARVHEHAARRGEPAVLLTFEPLPREYLAPNDPPARLTSLRERWRILSGTGLDYLWLLRFGGALRNLPGEAFAQLLASCAPGSWSSVTTFASDAMARGPSLSCPRPGRVWGSTWTCWPR